MKACVRRITFKTEKTGGRIHLNGPVIAGFSFTDSSVNAIDSLIPGYIIANLSGRMFSPPHDVPSEADPRYWLLDKRSLI